MATAREIRRRIRSISNIAKVTGALEAVSASKVRRAQNAAMATRYYARAARQILADLGARSDGGLSHPLLDDRDQVRQLTLVLITSDRGLAGPYNTNVGRAAMEFMRDRADTPVRVITIGRKGRDLMVRRGANIVADFSQKLPDNPSLAKVKPVTRAILEDFLSGHSDEVWIAFTDFVNTLRQEPMVTRLLPLKPHETEFYGDGPQMTPSAMHALYIYEPDAQSILDQALPDFTELQFYQALLESLASEHSARMVAMRSATENANALVEDLTLTYNKARQLAITSEMLDIVGGAEALDQK
jgi:F-type H+-transporting ATPase subunit gamma